MVQLNIGRAHLDDKCPRHVLFYDFNCFKYLICYRGDKSIPFKVEQDTDTEELSLEDSCDIFFIY